MRGALALAVLLAGCGQRLVDENRNVTANQIERLSTPRVQAPPDPTVTARLQPLRPDDLLTDAPTGAGGCDFGHNGQLYIRSAGSDSIARVDGILLHLVHSAPVTATGGFFEDRMRSISVGRDPRAAAAGDTGSWPARAHVANRRTHAQTELDGVWRCGP
jgi:hypothetical protein